MTGRPVSWIVEQHPHGVLRVAFEGCGGIGSEGAPDGTRMREAILEAIRQFGPRSLIIDFGGFEYRYGDYILTMAIRVLKV
ncbi:MAG TPA: hypothetical protein VFG14_02115 [Chthoniobacteraceae bacterium]|nr:hypothetical protein [Chthoniobacteraceae bacterium]